VGALGPAIGRVEVEGRRRRRRSIRGSRLSTGRPYRPVFVRPRPGSRTGTGVSSAWERGAGAHVTRDSARPEAPGAPPYDRPSPMTERSISTRCARKCRPGDTGEMIAIFGDEDVGEQRRPGRPSRSAASAWAPARPSRRRGSSSRANMQHALESVREHIPGPCAHRADPAELRCAAVGQTQGASCTIVSSGR